MEEILSIGGNNDTSRRKRLLLQELKQHGVILEEDEALKATEYTLERLLQEVKSKQDTSTTTPSPHSQDLFMDLYESTVRDYISKLTVASVFFFSCNPWAALFWPPYYYYYYHNNKGHERKMSEGSQ